MIERAWLFTFRDSLIYRQRIVESLEEAERVYGSLGVDLGMHAEDSPKTR
jgi:hypothetical protein